MANLRKRLAVYYSDEGKEDLLIVDFPKRNAYRPRYAYNSTNDAAKRVDRARRAFGRAFPDELERCATIVQQVVECTELYPAYANGFGLLAELILICCASDYHGAFPAQEAIPKAEAAVDKCLQLNDGWLRGGAPLLPFPMGAGSSRF